MHCDVWPHFWGIKTSFLSGSWILKTKIAVIWALPCCSRDSNSWDSPGSLGFCDSAKLQWCLWKPQDWLVTKRNLILTKEGIFQAWHIFTWTAFYTHGSRPSSLQKWAWEAILQCSRLFIWKYPNNHKLWERRNCGSVVPSVLGTGYTLWWMS